MDIIKFSLEKPVTVIVGIILIVLFGIIALFKMPYQLTPSVTEPEITVSTFWKGATPYEIEREIIEEQEKVLKGIVGLTEMESSSYNGSGSITLKFKIGTVINDALVRVSNKLDEVPSYPENVDKPVIDATGASTSPVIWMIFRTLEDNPRSIYTYRTFFDDEIEQYLERVEGVADLFKRGGTETEMHVIIDPEKLAAYSLTINDIINLLRKENINVSAGNMGVGRRDYRVRTVAEFKTPQEIENIIIKSTGQQRIKISDIGKVQFGYEKLTDAMLYNGKEGMAVGVKPEPGANILELTDRVEKVVKKLNEEKLKPKGVYLKWVYDQRRYIRGAINLVKQNILFGGALAVLVLLIFLRSILSTIIVALSIPISVIGTFIFLNGFGRNLNVISLAGISFAVGMLVDNAIVVIENIDRHRKMGKSAFNAAYDATKEVWGAVLASTLTTVAVFLPVVFVQEEAGQLFGDIALAVTCAVTLSLFVSVSVIPMLSQKLFNLIDKKKAHTVQKGPKKGVLIFLGSLISRFFITLSSFATKNWATRLFTVVLLTSAAILSSIVLFPKMEYLPQGNRNLLINILVPPPGLSYEEKRDIGVYIFDILTPYFQKDHEGFPGIAGVFYIGSESFMLFGALSMHEQRAGELIPLFTRVIYSIPGMFGISTQAGIFETQIGKGRTIEVNVGSNDLNRTVQAAGALLGAIKKQIPEAQIRPVPSLELLYPEVRLVPLRDRLKSVNMDTEDLGIAIDVLMDGREVGDYKEEGRKKIDLVLKSSDKEISTPELLYNTLIVTPQGQLMPLSSLTKFQTTTGMSQIRHLERQRTITLEVTPPAAIPLQEAMDLIDTTVIPELKSHGVLKGIDIRKSGVADKLTQTRKALQGNFLLAIAITYLLMSALFANFIYPFIIMFTIPLAAAGGIAGLELVNTFIAPQPLDILTMLGFIILIGVVVNNAILIVHQSLNNVRFQNMSYQDAVIESTRTRLRPIYMSAATSIFGMLPLVVAPGPGSELYRGLGSVVLGGLALSTIFTIFVIPALLMFFIKMEKYQGNTQ